MKKHHYGFFSIQNGKDRQRMREKKIQKIEKHQYGFFSSQNMTGEAQNVRKKNSRSNPFQSDLE